MGDEENITFPYTCLQDGVIRIGLRTTATDNSYGILYINGIIVAQNQNFGAGATLVVQSYRVNTGDVLSIKTTLGADVPIAKFMPYK